MIIRKISTTAIQNHPENPHTAPLGPIIESINENGVYAPIVVSSKTGNILKGNHTFKVLVSLGKKEVDAVVLDDLTSEQEIKILIGDNKIAQLGYDNDKKLKELLETLETYEGTGFKQKPEAGGAILEDELTQETLESSKEDVPQLAKHQTIYQVGKHKLYTGSCLDGTFCELFDEGEEAGLVLTDPPYNVGYIGVDSYSESKDNVIKNDKMSVLEYSVFARD